MIWVTLLRRFWPYLAALGLLAGAWLWYRRQIHEADVAGYKRAQAEFTAELERMRQHYQDLGQEVQRDHQQRIEKLRAAAARELRRRPIHCMLGGADQVRADQDTGKPPGGSGGRPDVQSDVDLRSRILQQGETCERLRQQLIAIKKLQN